MLIVIKWSTGQKQKNDEMNLHLVILGSVVRVEGVIHWKVESCLLLSFHFPSVAKNQTIPVNNAPVMHAHANKGTGMCVDDGWGDGGD